MGELDPSSTSEQLLPRARRRSRRRDLKLARVGLIAGTIVVVLSVAIGAWAYIFGGSGTSAVDGKLANSLRRATTTTATTAPHVTTTTKPKLKEPKTIVLPALPDGALHIGSQGPVVLAYERRLKSLHFDPGPVDGVYDLDTMYAVQAVEKLYGLDRDGAIGPNVRFALSTFHWPKPLVPKGERDRVEIDLDRQVLTLYKGGQIDLITTTSTGSGHAFCGGSDGCQYALTPPGKYAFQWHHVGWDKGKLGELYNPFYFNGGIAVHGYPSVPPYPASHGCARIPMHIADYFQSLVWKGMPVYVLGTEAPRVGTFPPPTTSTTKPATTTTVKKGKKSTTTTTKPKSPTSTTVASKPPKTTPKTTAPKGP